MFTKKYVGPANCASCEKGIVNLIGQPVDYYAWKRLPFREPSERIARYGQGFSKILTMMRPSDSQHQMNNHSALEHRNSSFNNTYGPEGYSPHKHNTLEEEFNGNAEFHLHLAKSP